MFYAVQQNQQHRTAQPAKSGNQKRVQKALSILQLLSGVVIGLFIAGIVAPSFLRSETTTSNDLVVGSLHTLTVGRITFTSTLQNLGSALLGGLFGSLTALAIEFPAPVTRTIRSLSMFLQADWKGFQRQSGRPSGIGNRKLA